MKISSLSPDPAVAALPAFDSSAGVAWDFSSVVVESSRSLREHLRRSLLAALPGSAVRSMATATEALGDLRGRPAGFVVVGLDLPDLDGMDLIETIALERLAWRILAVVRRSDENTQEWLRRAPIDGWFDDLTDEPENIAAAIARVAAGRRYASPWRTAVAAPGPTLGQLMSARERLVFSAIGAGADDVRAAVRLGISADTVHWHRQQIMRKVGVQSRGELVRQALARGLIRIVGGNVLHPGYERALARREIGSRAAAAA